MRFAIFPLHLSKVPRLPRKIDARSYEVLHLSRKIILANLQIWCSKMQPLSGNQRPDLLTSLMNISFVLRLPREMHLCRSSSNVPRLPSFLEMLQNPHVLLTFEKVHNPLRLPRESTSEHPKMHFWLRNMLRATTSCTFSTSQLLKVVRQWCVLYILTSRCASRHNGVHFFDIATSKSGPKLVCFVHFGFEMCFTPQRRAIFHLSSWPDGSAPPALATYFSTLRSHKSLENTVFRDFPTFSRICIFFLLTLSLLWSSLFYSSLLSDSSHLCFSSVHIVGSLTSKLPSIDIIMCTVYMPMFCISSMVVLPCLTSRSLYHLGLCPGEIRQALRLKVLQGMTTDHGYNWYPLVIPIFSYNHDD